MSPLSPSKSTPIESHGCQWWHQAMCKTSISRQLSELHANHLLTVTDLKLKQILRVTLDKSIC